MNPQLAHSLKQVGIAIVLSALGIVGASQTDILTGLGVDPLVYGAIVSAVIAALVRTFEGFKDGQRASGTVANMQESDVGFKQVLTKAEVGQTAHISAAVADDKGKKIDVTVSRVGDPAPFGVPTGEIELAADKLPYSY